MANIADVARAAGVSTATVSRTLSNPALVSEAARRQVQQAILALNYSPNGAAKNLRTTRSMKIIISVPDISNPFFSSVMRGAERAAQRRGFAILIGDTRHDSDKEEYYARMLLRREADGIVFLGHHIAPSAAALVARLGDMAPVVNGCEYAPELGVPSVHIANDVAAADAMRHLYDLGHVRVGVATGPLSSPLSRDRLAGVRIAAAERGLTKKLLIESGEFTVESGEALATAMLGSSMPPTAMFCFSDEMAIGALAGIREAGLNCPGDISVIGFDDIRYARVTEPPLTTIRQPMEEIGTRTVEMLISILERRTQDVRSQTLRHELVVRASTARII